MMPGLGLSPGGRGPQSPVILIVCPSTAISDSNFACESAMPRPWGMLGYGGAHAGCRLFPSHRAGAVVREVAFLSRL
jgi:hypothetical protein